MVEVIVSKSDEDVAQHRTEVVTQMIDAIVTAINQVEADYSANEMISAILTAAGHVIESTLDCSAGYGARLRNHSIASDAVARLWARIKVDLGTIH